MCLLHMLQGVSLTVHTSRVIIHPLVLLSKRHGIACLEDPACEFRLSQVLRPLIAPFNNRCYRLDLSSNMDRV